MFIFGEQNGDKIKTCRELIDPLINMAVVKYLGTALRNYNCMREEMSVWIQDMS